MSELVMLVVGIAYFLSAFPIVTWFSVAVTLVHTLDEIMSEGGPIWEYLSGLSGISKVLLLPGYFLFQGSLILLALVAFSTNSWWLVLLLGIRVFDALFTHWTLSFFRLPNPGVATSPLLLVDALSILIVLI